MNNKLITITLYERRTKRFAIRLDLKLKKPLPDVPKVAIKTVQRIVAEQKIVAGVPYSVEYMCGTFQDGYMVEAAK